jgi:uncharacterized C2H2 Zn-finger protein
LIANSDDHPNNAEDGDHRLDGEHGNYTIEAKICPYVGYTRTKGFDTRQRLRRHFQQCTFYTFLLSHYKLLIIYEIDVVCEEVCVFCFKVYRTASEFIRHVKDAHEEMTGMKADYMRNRYKEVDCRVVSELAEKIKAAAAAVKRRWEDIADGEHKFRRVKRVAQSAEGIYLLNILWLY